MSESISEQPQRTGSLINIGQLFSGMVKMPEIAAEALHFTNGIVDRIGSNGDVLSLESDRVVDVSGMTVIPGLIDTHVHPLLGDWTSRHNIADWIAGYGRAGITTVVSQGSPHLHGRPRDAVGTKSLAILSARIFATYRPGGVRVVAGTVLLEPGLTDEDFAEMVDSGVGYVGEIGISGVQDPVEVGEMVAAARAVGMRVSMHFGGPSVAGSRAMGIAEALVIDPDILAHANGGSTGRPDAELLDAVGTTTASLEGNFHGGLRQFLLVADALADQGDMGRLILGSDSPSAVGIVPQAIMRLITYLHGMAGWTLGDAVAAGTGNAQQAFGLPAGVIAVGQPADLLCIDAPLGSSAGTAGEAIAHGDVPGIGAVVQDGNFMEGRAINAPYANREVRLGGPHAS